MRRFTRRVLHEQIRDLILAIQAEQTRLTEYDQPSYELQAVQEGLEEFLQQDHRKWSPARCSEVLDQANATLCDICRGEYLELSWSFRQMFATLPPTDEWVEGEDYCYNSGHPYINLQPVT